MPRWIITNDQGFEATASEASQELESQTEETCSSLKLWKLVGHSEVEVSVSLVED